MFKPRLDVQGVALQLSKDQKGSAMTMSVRSYSRRALLSTLAVALLTIAASASPPANSTVMTVGEMCGGCVKKITARLEKMPDVGKIECEIMKKTVTVTPAAGKTLSAITVWDAMAEIGKTPKKLVGPSGTYTARPKG